VGVLLAALFRRRWLTLAGFGLILVALFLPGHSIIRLVLTGFGTGLIVAQIPVAIRARRRERERSSDTY